LSRTRWDETWHRLRDWTSGQARSERLGVQVLLNEGFVSVDPSHPLGGPDGGKDAVCLKDGNRWVMAVHFPRGESTFTSIRKKFLEDVAGASAQAPYGIAFVTNQELALAERESLKESAAPLAVDLYHLERIATILDSPPMAEVRRQFLDIEPDDQASLLLGGQGGLAPGAGGGGGGAYGDNAQGGQGGSGGEQVYVGIGPDEAAALRDAGFKRMNIRVGKGGQSGAPGEDSVVDFVTGDGTVLKSIVAKGGKAGASPRQGATGRDAEAGDIDSGLRITTLTLAECWQLSNGLISLLGAGWEHYQFQTIPFEVDWPLVCSIDTASIEAGSVLVFSATVEDPAGLQILEEPFSILCGGGLVSRPTVVVPIRFSGSQTGVWVIRIVSGAIVLAELPIEIKGPQPVSDGDSPQ
jgi:hypothetical protein